MLFIYPVIFCTMNSAWLIFLVSGCHVWSKAHHINPNTEISDIVWGKFNWFPNPQWVLCSLPRFRCSEGDGLSFWGCNRYCIYWPSSKDYTISVEYCANWLRQLQKVMKPISQGNWRKESMSQHIVLWFRWLLCMTVAWNGFSALLIPLISGRLPVWWWWWLHICCWGIF